MTDFKLTNRQLEILNLIVNRIETTGYPPTRAEIATKMGFRSPNAAEDHLRALAKKGVLELLPGTSRGIRLLRNHGGVPLIGKVAAGEPILAQENIEKSYNLAKHLFNSNINYLLRVCGDSMQNAGILNGDLLAVQSCKQATEGQIVVARINDEVTVKRFYQNDNIVTLKPENNAYQAIQIDLNQQDLFIEGIGIGVVRSF